MFKMVLSNSSEIINIMTAFFYMSFREIAETGFDLLSLETVRAVLSESHIVTLRHQILQLQSVEKKINQELPSLSVLREFLDLLKYLGNLQTSRTKDSS